MTAPASTAPRRSIRHFARHYLEMVVAMVLGMVVLGAPAAALLGLFGVTIAELHDDAPALALLGMAATMTVPMVAWMRYRGHGWRASNEMAASMFLPTFAVIGLLAAGVVTDFGSLMGLEHMVMLPAMLVAMLLRIDEYAGGHDHGVAAPTALARQEAAA
jgi:hypothetical protein